jgi:glycosyltransferase involved in cell wall biosynthesis
MGLFVKITPGELTYASRDKRELSVVRELGHEVIVVAISDKRINEIIDIDGWNVHCRSTRPLGQNRLLTINRLVSIFTWAKYVRRLKADYLSGHDIMGLLIAWISTWFLFHKKRPILIYDAHEFEAGQIIKRSRISTWFTISLEHFLMQRTSINMVVNDTIADEVQKLHKLKKRPIVIRNFASYWETNEEIIKQRRDEYNALMNIDDGSDIFLIMYHGGLQRGRGIENLIMAVSRMDNVGLIVMGFGEPDYLQNLHSLVEKEQVKEKLLFYSAVPHEVLWQYLGAADVGMVNIENACKSYYFSLPNKLSENIQAETPVIGSDFPEISRIINKYNIGVTCNSNDVDNIISSIEEMRKNKERYADFKRNVKIAKKELSWENEKILLMREYKKLLVMKH